ncbi:Transcription initiation factor IIA subunit [Trichinella spiralis]|uniref:Transcription initiation factor IIA subunit n=1 Tax=Trichinella spiralis TaxID=6334 RepID=A0ABR3KMD6_TRISP
MQIVSEFNKITVRCVTVCLDRYFRQKSTYFSESNIMAYQLYRNTTLGSTLQETLDEFIQSGQITQQLAFKVRSKIQFRAGKLCTYRFCDNKR